MGYINKYDVFFLLRRFIEHHEYSEDRLTFSMVKKVFSHNSRWAKPKHTVKLLKENYIELNDFIETIKHLEETHALTYSKGRDANLEYIESLRKYSRKLKFGLVHKKLDKQTYIQSLQELKMWRNKYLDSRVTNDDFFQFLTLKMGFPQNPQTLKNMYDPNRNDRYYQEEKKKILKMYKSLQDKSNIDSISFIEYLLDFDLTVLNRRELEQLFTSN